MNEAGVEYCFMEVSSHGIHKKRTEALHFAGQNNLAVTVLGGGSNVLISDRGVKGLVICLQKFSGKMIVKNLIRKKYFNFLKI